MDFALSRNDRCPLFQQAVIFTQKSLELWQQRVGLEKINPQHDRNMARQAVWLCAESNKPDNKSPKPVSREMFEQLVGENLLHVAKTRADWDWKIAEWLLQEANKEWKPLDSNDVRRRAQDIYEARRNKSEEENRKLAEIFVQTHYSVDETQLVS